MSTSVTRQKSNALAFERAYDERSRMVVQTECQL